MDKCLPTRNFGFTINVFWKRMIQLKITCYLLINLSVADLMFDFRGLQPSICGLVRYLIMWVGYVVQE